MCPEIEINSMDKKKAEQVDGEQLWWGWDSRKETLSVELRAGEGGGLSKDGCRCKKDPSASLQEGACLTCLRNTKEVLVIRAKGTSSRAARKSQTSTGLWLL